MVDFVVTERDGITGRLWTRAQREHNVLPGAWEV